MAFLVKVPWLFPVALGISSKVHNEAFKIALQSSVCFLGLPDSFRASAPQLENAQLLKLLLLFPKGNYIMSHFSYFNTSSLGPQIL